MRRSVGYSFGPAHLVNGPGMCVSCRPSISKDGALPFAWSIHLEGADIKLSCLSFTYIIRIQPDLWAWGFTMESRLYLGRVFILCMH